MQLHERLKQERLRLGMTLKVFAEKAQSKERTVIDWESGKSSPTAKQLALLAGSGVNTHYIITGEWQVKEIDLEEDEKALIECLRSASKQHKFMLLEMVRLINQGKEKNA